MKELAKDMNEFYVRKINSVVMTSGNFIKLFLQLVLDYNNLFESHIQKMELGIQKVPENLKEILQKVHTFKSDFHKNWMNKRKKTERLLIYIFEIHMANILVIFKNYKVDVEPKTQRFLEGFEKLFLRFEKDKTYEESKLLQIIKLFK